MWKTSVNVVIVVALLTAPLIHAEMICSADCRSIVFSPDNILIEDCTTSYCHDPPTSDARCSVAPRCMGAPLVCAQEGVYPDPYFCAVSHTCSAASGYSTPAQCTDAAYNIVTGDCDLPLDHPICGGPVPECATFLQSGALPRNRNFYYRCRRDGTILYPQLYQCPEGLHFYPDIGSIGDCAEPIETTTEEVTTTEEPTTTTEEQTGTTTNHITCTADCMGLLFQDGAVSPCDSSPQLYCHGPSSTDAACSVSARCYGAPLSCAQEGVFPDPYFCSIYHTCSSASYSEVSTCSDYGYNIATGQCDLEACVGTPVEECVRLPQSAALSANPNYYYICVEDGRILYPLLMRCPEGQVYDNDLGACL